MSSDKVHVWFCSKQVADRVGPQDGHQVLDDVDPRDLGVSCDCSEADSDVPGSDMFVPMQ